MSNDVADRIEKLETALAALADSERKYRLEHDLYGGGDIRVGRAWDLMRHAGDEARALLSEPEQDETFGGSIGSAS